MSDNEEVREIRARHEAGERASADADREWLLAEVERLRARPLQWPPPIGAGCVCPPAAPQYCANQWCPRRNPPGVTCGGA